MAHRNPLHPIVPTSAQSGFSTLSGAPSTKLASSKRVRVPQKPFSPKNGPPQKLSAPITFDYAGNSGQGVPMREFSSSATPRINGAGDVAFQKPGVTRITFHILWPGYPQVEWFRTVEINTKTGPMTRAQLGSVVAGNFMRFIEKSQYEAIARQDASWQVGPGHIRYENLVLLSVWNTYENSWQADVAVDF